MESNIQKISSCRVCSSTQLEQIHDFGIVPLADKLADYPNQPIPTASLSISFCKNCFHLQVNENIDPAILFKDNYPYYSSQIPELREHFKDYAQSIGDRYKICEQDLILEIASNDGLLLNYFKNFSSNVLGIDPSIGPAQAANKKEVPTRCVFFNKSVAKEIKTENLKPRLIIANNVLAHVPDPQEFADAIGEISTDDTMLIVEVPHMLPMIQKSTFDVIFHQHYSYFSLHSLIMLWQNAGFYIHDIDRVDTQGGSLRIHLSQNKPKYLPEIVEKILMEEKLNGLHMLHTFKLFSGKIDQLKEICRHFLLQLLESKMKVVGYGAPGKAATLLNYFGINTTLITYLVDISPSKHGKYFPNAYLPIYPISKLENDIPDYILILAWNYADSIIQSLNYLREKGTKFIVLYPSLRVI